MNYQDQVLALFAEANPVSDLDTLEDLMSPRLKAVEQRTGDMTETKVRGIDPNRPIVTKERRRGLVYGVAVSVAVLMVGAVTWLAFLNDAESDVATAPVDTTLSSSSDDPASVLADYAETRNSGDVDAVMAFYADDAVVRGHPLDDDDVATGIDEIRVLQEQLPAIQGSGAGLEYFDIVVSGSTATFKHTFSYGADGTASGGSAGCVGGIDNTATFEDGKITLYDWGIGSSTCRYISGGPGPALTGRAT